ncbi:MAG: hypothetical protein MUD05_10780 [Candidatus Nanopelagicales bacterium]|nr:hypothetical protein [Candidatus Nanopelagicales bacterium]
MGVLVDQNLERMREVLSTGSTEIARRALEVDDDIDAMNVSLTERCYDVLALENPMASDLRLVVSVIKYTGSLERIGDLSLRVVKLAPEWGLIKGNPETYDMLQTMADLAVERYRDAERAWASEDLPLADRLAAGSENMAHLSEALATALLRLSGEDAVPTALHSLSVGHSLQRISDHCTLLGRRIQYLLTGDKGHLAAEVR